MSGRIVCVGNGVLDQVYEVDALPRAGVKTTARAFRESGGGPAATAAVAIARLGGRAAWWGRVGEDAAGRFLREELTRHGVDLSGLRTVPGARTVRATVIVDPAGERSILVDRAGMPSDAGLPAGRRSRRRGGAPRRHALARRRRRRPSAAPATRA